jgi:hypothetical protein
MPNLLGLSGAQAQKPTRFAPIYTGRWSSGIWTNRSPLRDAATTRISEKYYGAAGDALIAGTNVEITNRLTLARRPGNPTFDRVNRWGNIDRFYDFRLFSSTSEEIEVMVDQADALYSLYATVKTLLWTKQAGAGQSFMQSVGNSLYWGDGISNKKWLQTLTTWAPGMSWNGSNTPFLSTFFIDNNGNIQQLTNAVIPVTSVQITGNVLTATSNQILTSVLSIGDEILFPASMTAAYLENKTVTITGVSRTAFTADFTNPDYGPVAETNVLGTEVTGTATPVSGSVQPTWSPVVPSSSNLFQGGITIDGTAQWTNRGNPVENWGLANTGKAITEGVGTSTVSWQASTYYSLPGVVIDSNGNLQQVITLGLSGAHTPGWATSVGTTTTDNTVLWRMIQTAASLNWTAHTAYTPTTALSLTSVANAVGATTVYTGLITGGASGGLIGTVFVISGFTNTVNNGTYTCTASTLTTLTLQNASGVSETNLATANTVGSYVVGNAYGTNCLFTLAPSVQPNITGDVSAYLYPGDTFGPFVLKNPTSIGSASASTTTQNSLSFFGVPGSGTGPIYWDIVNGAGEGVGSNIPFPSYKSNFQLIILGSLDVAVPGQYSFKATHHDGMFLGFGNGATLVSGPSAASNAQGQTITAAQGYPSFGGTNNVGLEGGAPPYVDNYVINYPTAGVYPFEMDYAYWYHYGIEMQVQCNGFTLANGNPISGTNAPVWPGWSTTYAPGYPTVTETNGQLTWINLGPVTDFVWSATTNFTLPNTSIIDPNGYTENPYRTGVSGATVPTFQIGNYALTLDNPNLIWINEGIAATAPTGTVSTYNGGWKYGVALVNTLDNTVSNMSPISAATGNFTGVSGVTIAPGAGLPPIVDIDPQADYVAIFRTTDGQSTPFLIPGKFTTYTIPLAQYLANGYVDNTPDTGLNNLIEGAVEGENTPPGNGAANLTFHLNRIWFSIGNTVYWTAGPDTPVGNGVNGVPPLNFDTFPSLVKRIVPTTSGAMIFTVSDVYLIQGTGTSSNPIQSGIPIMQGVGLLSYNALDVNGSVIGFFTTDRQFCIVDPSNGVSYAGFPIGDQLRLNNGIPGQTWDPSNVYVAWFVNGEDQGWYVCDGLWGWYRLMPTPAPESGYTWSPYAAIVGGIKTVQSIEVKPGVHKLLMGASNTGQILCRDVTTAQDNGVNFPANATVGSAVLAQPGQVATVAFIATESVRTGTPLTLGVMLDEALPYYTGPVDQLTEWVDDPPGLKPSRSFYGQRFYLSEMEDEAVCRHMQITIQWAAENALNELLSLTVFGAFMQEN